MNTKEYWKKWYAIPKNKFHHRAMSRKWKRDIRALLIARKGNKCENCTVNYMHSLHLHEVNGNTNNHSNKRFTDMRDNKIEYQVLCESCHSKTPNYCGKH